MGEKGYDFQTVKPNIIQYEFDSISEKKSVKKVIEYALIDKDTLLYNLSLLDVTKDEVSDISISNNKDMPKVLATVYQTLLDFFTANPKAKVIFQGNTPSRNRLYRAAIGKLKDVEEPDFRIFGFING